MAPSGHIYKVLTCTSVKNRGFDSRTGITKKIYTCRNENLLEIEKLGNAVCSS